jgi:uncharacterized protein with NRDE domain
VVAANRDERLGRPSEGWALRQGRTGARWAAPLDVKEGGTWMGVAAGGVFAGITNYRAPSDHHPDPDRPSRGELVTLALDRPRPRRRGGPWPRWTRRYNPFHLLVADRRSAFLWWCDGEAFAFEDLAPGLHLVTENSPYGRCPRGDACGPLAGGRVGGRPGDASHLSFDLRLRPPRPALRHAVFGGAPAG